MQNCELCSVAGTSVDTMVFFLNDGLTPTTDVMQCPACGYVWLDPKIDPDELQIYYSNQNRSTTETVAYKEQLAFLERFVKFLSIKAALDIGSFDGRLMKLVQLAGTDKVNCVEPDIKHSGEGFRTIEDAMSIAGQDSYGLITMGHVFEHVQNPVQTLVQCK